MDRQTSPENKSEDKSENNEKIISDTKECPYCAETIKVKAKICRFCNRVLAPDISSQKEQEETKLKLIATMEREVGQIANV